MTRRREDRSCSALRDPDGTVVSDDSARVIFGCLGLAEDDCAERIRPRPS